jgi:hypothetical protein
LRLADWQKVHSIGSGARGPRPSHAIDRANEVGVSDLESRQRAIAA